MSLTIHTETSGCYQLPSDSTRHQILSKQGGDTLYKNMFEISDNWRESNADVLSRNYL